uniref:ATP synthase complex subunit 8 n=1 Tax=Pseudabris przewalskyi TaxID=3047135 RepID=A0AA51NI79_9CUCU|nr:ATP synthase F0 subunit 8 [Pseudabris przewalskyi]WMQ52478.1 ATP synthase F0 subunit 8 [Pseudabris przewalskyi]
MPQMAPLNWLSLMIYFIVIFITLASLNFFAFPYTMKLKETPSKLSLQTIWKWL